MIRADDVRNAAFAAARKTRDQLVALPERLATVIAATADAAEIRQILKDEVVRIYPGNIDAERP